MEYEQAESAPTNAGTRPIISFGGSGNVNVAVWKEKTDGGFDRYNIRIDRSYKADENNYKTTNYLRDQDLLRVSELLRDADLWIEQDKQRQRTAASKVRG